MSPNKKIGSETLTLNDIQLIKYNRMQRGREPHAYHSLIRSHLATLNCCIFQYEKPFLRLLVLSPTHLDINLLC